MQPQRQAPAAGTQQAASMCCLTQERGTSATHKASNSCKHILGYAGSYPCWLTQEARMQATKASNRCKHIASNQLRWLLRGPSSNASHKGKQQLQAHSEQLTCAGTHKGPATMQAAQASNSCKHVASSYQCGLTQEPGTKASHQASTSCKHPASNSPVLAVTQELSTNASHKGKQQLQAHGKQQPLLAPTRAQHQCKPQGNQQLQAQSEQPICAGAPTSTAPMQATKASSNSKHTASYKPALAHARAQH